MDDLKTKSVPALERALTILEMLANSRTGLTLAEITRHLGIARVCALFVVDSGAEWLPQRNSQTARYMFGLKLFSLANMALSGLGGAEQAVPFLTP